MEVRLDRVLTNNSWLSLFPFAKLHNMEGSPSDHSLLFLDLGKQGGGAEKKRFRFENAWTSEPMCFQVVKDVWDSNINLDIMQKIKQCGERLEVWGKEVT